MIRNPSNKIQLAAKLMSKMTGASLIEGKPPAAWSQPLVAKAPWTAPILLVINALELKVSPDNLLKELAETSNPLAVVSKQLLYALTKVEWAPGQQAPHEWYAPIIDGGKITPLSMIAVKLGVSGSDILKALNIKDSNKRSRRNPVYRDLDLLREALLVMKKISGVDIRDARAIEIYNAPLAFDPNSKQTITLFSLIAASLGLDDEHLYTIVLEHPDFPFLVEELEHFSGLTWQPHQTPAPDEWFVALNRKDPYPGRSLLETVGPQYQPTFNNDQWSKIFDATHRGMVGKTYKIPDHKKVGLGKSWLKGRKRPPTLVDPVALGLLLDHITSTQQTITLATAMKLLDDLDIFEDLSALEKRNTTRKVYIQNLINRDYLQAIGKTGSPPDLTYEWTGSKDPSKGRDKLLARGGSVIWEYKPVENRSETVPEVSTGEKVELETNEPEAEIEEDKPEEIEEILETYTYVPYVAPEKSLVAEPSEQLRGWTLNRKPRVMVMGGEQGERQLKGHEDWLNKYFELRAVNMSLNESKQSAVNRVKNFAPDLLIVISSFFDSKTTAALQNVPGPITVSKIGQKSLRSINMAYESLKASGRAPWFIDAYDRSNS